MSKEYFLCIVGIMEKVRKQYESSHWIYTRHFCLSWMGLDKSRIILLDKNNCGDTDWWRMQGALVHTKHAKIAFGARSSAHGLLSCATLALRMLGGTVFSPKSSCNYAYVSVVVCQNSLWVNVEALRVALMSKRKKKSEGIRKQICSWRACVPLSTLPCLPCSPL